MKDLVLAVASKGRATTSVILKRCKNIVDKVTIYVYVDENEAAIYKEEYPDFKVVTHNYKNILDIRHFVQEHQYELDNNVLMLDDDIVKFSWVATSNITEWFDMSMMDLVNNANQKLADGYDFTYAIYQECREFHMKSVLAKDDPSLDELTNGWYPVAMSCVAMTPKLWDLGVRYKTGGIGKSEDINISVQTRIAEAKGLIKVGYLDCAFWFDDSVLMLNTAHFKSDFYYEAVLETYINYGYVLEFWAHPGMCKVPYTYLNKAGVEAYVQNDCKPIFAPYYDILCSYILKENARGYKALEDWKWKPTIKDYNRGILRKISSRKRLHAALAKKWDAPDGLPSWLTELSMSGKTYGLTSAPKVINEHYLKKIMIDCTNENGDIVNDISFEWDKLDCEEDCTCATKQ